MQEQGSQPALVAERTREAEALVEGAKGLEVRVQRELERLQDACKLWCICRQPYNEERPMLACDYCNDWFHYDCVGLRAPSEDEDDDDVAPKDYRCPNCTAKVSACVHHHAFCTSSGAGHAPSTSAVHACGPCLCRIACDAHCPAPFLPGAVVSSVQLSSLRLYA